MSRVWKWILGIGGVLLLCAVLGSVAGFFALRSGALGSGRLLGRAQSADGPEMWRMPMYRDFGGPDERYGPQGARPEGYPPHMQMYRGFGSVRFGIGRMILGGVLRPLLTLAVLALVGVGGYLLGRNSRSRTAPPAVEPPPAPVSAEPGDGMPGPEESTSEEPARPS
jgi:hypothetical protein